MWQVVLHVAKNDLKYHDVAPLRRKPQCISFSAVYGIIARLNNLKLQTELEFEGEMTKIYIFMA